VVDPAGQPVVSAIIEVPELGRSVVAGSDGRFSIAIAAGRYTLAVRRDGYAPAVREVAVGAGAPVPIEIVLAPSAFRLEPVTVTATRQPLATATSPLPATALSGEELRQAQGVSLAHVVAALPGVRAITTGAQIGKPMIRGPASVLYGSDALGGVINVIPDQLPDAAGGPGFMRTGFTLSGASNNVELGLGARAEGARGNLGWRVAAIGRHSGNLHTPAGELDNTGFGAFNGEAGAGWRWPSGSALAVRVIHYGGEFKLLEANAPPGETGGPERKSGDERVQLTAQRPFGNWRLEAKGQVQRHSLIEVADDTTGTESEAFNLLLQTASLDLLAHHGGVTFGVTGVGQSNDASGREPIVPDGSIVSGAGFVFGQGSWGRVLVLAGARVDGRRLSVDRDDSLGVVAQDRSSSAFSSNLGVVFPAGHGWTLSLNGGRAWRAPTLFELFANGPHIGEARFERGDSTLKPERSYGVDFGVRWSGRRARVELAAYDNTMSDYIYIVPTVVFIDSLRVYQYAQAKAQMVGGEALLEADIGRGLIAVGRLEAVRGTNTTSDEPLPLIPALRGAFGLRWRDRLRVDVDAYARQNRPNPLDIPTPGYALLHLGGGGDLRLFGRPMRLDVSLRNALNQRYRSFLSRYKEFAFDPGRNLSVRLSSGFVD